MSVYDLYNLREYFNSISKSDEGAFATVFELYKRRVFAVALKMLKSETEAEEIIQEVFLSLWRSRKKMSQIENPEGYLFTITYNTIYAHLKKASRNQYLLEEIITHFEHVQNTIEDIIAEKETNKLIQEILQKLPRQQRKVYMLRKNDLSYEEIAVQLGLSKNTVRNHLAEAMKSIRTFLKQHISLFIF